MIWTSNSSFKTLSIIPSESEKFSLKLGNENNGISKLLCLEKREAAICKTLFPPLDPSDAAKRNKGLLYHTTFSTNYILS